MAELVTALHVYDANAVVQALSPLVDEYEAQGDGGGFTAWASERLQAADDADKLRAEMRKWGSVLAPGDGIDAWIAALDRILELVQTAQVDTDDDTLTASAWATYTAPVWVRVAQLQRKLDRVEGALNYYARAVQLLDDDTPLVRGSGLEHTKTTAKALLASLGVLEADEGPSAVLGAGAGVTNPSGMTAASVYDAPTGHVISKTAALEEQRKRVIAANTWGVGNQHSKRMRGGRGGGKGGRPARRPSSRGSSSGAEDLPLMPWMWAAARPSR
jgi:hypothetical protein